MSTVTTNGKLELDFGSGVSREESRNQLDQLSQKVYDQALDSLDQGKLTDLVGLDIGMLLTELTVSANETRRTEIQYCSNAYFASAKLDFTFARDFIRSQVAEVEPNLRIDRYLQLKEVYYKMAQVKWTGHEQYLRNLVREAEGKDGISPQGRFAQ